jgi:hypothetical protein
MGCLESKTIIFMVWLLIGVAWCEDIPQPVVLEPTTTQEPIMDNPPTWTDYYAQHPPSQIVPVTPAIGIAQQMQISQDNDVWWSGALGFLGNDTNTSMFKPDSIIPLFKPDHIVSILNA